jgi:hypothetical protein
LLHPKRTVQPRIAVGVPVRDLVALRVNPEIELGLQAREQALFLA